MKRLFAPVLAGLLMLVPLPVHASDTAVPGDPVYVDATETLYMESYPVQVGLLVDGSLPSPCHTAAWSVEDDGSVVTVLLWSEADADVMCAAVLEPVQLNIPLGSYEQAQRVVLLNGEPVGTIEIGDAPAAFPTLAGAGWSFGMCLGYCRAVLVIGSDAVTLTGADREGTEPTYVNSGRLSGAGIAATSATVSGVDPTELEATYGCPDCADGGAAYVTLRAGDRETRHDMEFGRPPAELAIAYALSQRLMSALEACESNELITVADDCVAYVAG